MQTPYITYRKCKYYHTDVFRSEIQILLFMTKEPHNAIMKRSRYRNKFLKDKSQTSRENYKIQQNFCKKLLRKTKKSYFESLNIKKSRIIEPSGNLLFLFSQIRRQEVKGLSLMKQKNIFLMIKEYAKFLITFFKRCLRLKNT